MPFNSFLNYPLSWKPDRQKLTRPIYLSLAKQLERDISQGFLIAGTKLPPQRELADFLDINFTTVTRAYKLCELKGLIYAVAGSGTFVAATASQSVTISSDNLPCGNIDLGFISSFEQCNFMITPVIKKVLSKRQVAELVDYNYPTGMPHHKSAGINWMKNLGLNVDEEHLAITSGALNGLTLILLALFEPGNRIAVDTYTFSNFIELAKMFHLQLIPIENDDEGMMPNILENKCKLNKIHGIFLMPSCANPTTIMMSYRRKKELADVIKKYNLILLEDDVYAFISAGIIADYTEPLFNLVPQNSVYICSTSKSICSGLRVAYIVFSSRFRDSILKSLYNVNVKTSSIDAEIVTEAILSGTANNIVKKKIILAEKTNAIFNKYFKQNNKNIHPLSFYRWLPIGNHQDGFQIEKIFQSKGLRVYHSDRFLCGSFENTHYLRIALSTVLSLDELHKGLSLLYDLINNH